MENSNNTQTYKKRSWKTSEDLVLMECNGNISKDDRQELFFYLRHVPNRNKTDKEFEIYCKMAKEKGIPEPNRASYVRPLHEKYDEQGVLIYPEL